MKPTLIRLAAAVALLSVPSAHADSSAIPTPHEIAGFAGYGFDTVYHLSFGGRYTYSFDWALPLTIGAQFTYGFGEGTAPATSLHSYQLAGEIGLNLAPYMPNSPWMIRPYVGIGLLHVGETVNEGFQTGRSATDFLVEPGVVAEYPLGPIFIAADLRIPVVSDHTSLEIFGSLGTHF